MKKKLIYFLITAVALISLWFYVYQFWIQAHTNLDHHLSVNLAQVGNFFLSIFGIDTYIEYSGTNYVIANLLGYEDHYGVWIGTRCNGFKMFGVFSVIVAAFPYAHKHKLWFIPLGILILHTLNAIRVAILTYMYVHAPEYVDFNHNVTFEILIYGSVFLLWYIWVKKFVEVSIKKTN